jgi:hypothetical protein
MIGHMAKSPNFPVTCPCCQAELNIDPDVRAVITYTAHEKPRELSDMEMAMDRFRGEAGKREDAFKKSVEAEKNKTSILDRKFDELLRQAKQNPDLPPPKRDIDFD